MGPLPDRPGISTSGADAEATFRTLTGATKADRAALGDAVLDGHYVEVKKAGSRVLNQVRAVKYITLVAFFTPTKQWYVIPANEIVRQCAAKRRGQHTENPFESATLNLRKLGCCRLDDVAQLRTAVLEAIAEAERFPMLKTLMDEVLEKSRKLAEESVAEVREALHGYGLA